MLQDISRSQSDPQPLRATLAKGKNFFFASEGSATLQIPMDPGRPARLPLDPGPAVGAPVAQPERKGLAEGIEELLLTHEVNRFARGGRMKSSHLLGGLAEEGVHGLNVVPLAKVTLRTSSTR
jgi:hypothetical protein